MKSRCCGFAHLGLLMVGCAQGHVYQVMGAPQKAVEDHRVALKTGNKVKAINKQARDGLLGLGEKP